MVEPVDAWAHEWSRRWQSALVQAHGPERGARLTRGELLKTGEIGLLAVPGAFFGAEVLLGDEAIPGRDSVASRRSETPIPGCVGWLVARARCKSDLTHRAWLQQRPSKNILCRARLARWANLVTSDNAKGAFECYLSFEGLDESAARRTVGPHNSAMVPRCQFGPRLWTGRCSHPL